MGEECLCLCHPDRHTRGSAGLRLIFKWEVYMGNWISFSFLKMNFLAADLIVLSDINIQLWASGAVLHHHTLHTSTQGATAISAPAFKQWSPSNLGHISRLNLHMKRNIKGVLQPIQRKLSLYLVCLVSMNSELFCSSKPLVAGGAQHVYILMKNSTRSSASLIRAQRLDPGRSCTPLPVKTLQANPFNASSD